MYGLCCVRSCEKFTLCSVSVDCSIRNLLVTCTSEIVYKNNTGNDTEAIFSFPLDGSCVVYSFEAIIGGKRIVGVCKELEEAKNLYKAAKEAGQKAALIERNLGMTDVFKCSIGNMPKNSEAKIILKFAMELKLSLSKSEQENIDRFCLCLPLILRPRYTPQEYTGDPEVYNVTNKYEYAFRASIIGTKEIKDVFSNNHQLKLVVTDDNKSRAQVTLESKYDGTHDLDVNIDYVKMKVPSVLYEYGTSSSKFTGEKVKGAFYQTDVAMLNFLPEFGKSTEAQNKMEIVFVVDRSGSMGGSNIEHAKQCLLIFLKSLPMNCKFQIYGFGSEFDKVFPQPQLYDDQSITTAMNYQRNLNADFGGTELMNPLKDVYNSTLSSDYTRVVFLLTDGDVGNQDEVFKLVRQHSDKTRLFTVGIGDGVSTSLVQKVAESGKGKSAFVRESKTLSESVIELLDIALSCDQFTISNIEWICPNNVTVAMVPSNVGPIFSNYFLTIFCMINGLKDGEKVKCILSGKVNDQPTKLSLDVSGKDGICDDEFRVHRLLAKYKIDEMTPKIEDGKTELKKSLIELSLDVNMVTNYTTFVAIDPDAPDKALVTEEEPIDYSGIYAPQSYGDRRKKFKLPWTKKEKSKRSDNASLSSQSIELDKKAESNLMMSVMCKSAAPKCKKSASASRKMRCMPAPRMMKCMAAPPCPPPAPGGGLMMMDCLLSNSPPVVGGYLAEEKEMAPSVEESNDMVLCLAEHQNINGSWPMDEGILKKMEIDFSKVKGGKPASISDEAWMTIIVYQYLHVKLNGREKEWRLLARKAKQWLSSSITDVGALEKLMEQGKAMI